jgi:dCMP deaminase
MSLAWQVSTRSTCERLAVGAVIVDPQTKRMISTGYNGSVRGQPHCTGSDELLTAGGCLCSNRRCMRTIHAEINAVVFAKESLDGKVIFVTHEPCENCTKVLAQAGIKKVFFSEDYGNVHNKYLRGEMEWKKI